MYLLAHFIADEEAAGRLLSDPGAADLITVTDRGLLVTYLPVLYEPAAGGLGSVLGHVARSNGQWSTPALGDALVIVHGADAYVSPSWYPSKAEHGRVVPTWDYVTAHVYGRLVVHDDPHWLESLVRKLTETHESASSKPWSVDDAPRSYLDAQLRAIVGVEVVVSRMEVKAKWSQNRPAADVDGVIAGLEGAGRSDAAAEVRAARGARTAPGVSADPGTGSAREARPPGRAR